MLYLQQGNADTAAFIFKGILDERPNYAYATAGLAQGNDAEKALYCGQRAFAASLQNRIRSALLPKISTCTRCVQPKRDQRWRRSSVKILL
jgi:hypothetical protein